MEAAAGIGRLAKHILEFAQNKLPDFYAALHYVAVERSPARCDQMAEQLARFLQEGKCRPSLEIPARIPAGCIFSNELLDALPVHRIRQQEGRLQEIFVGNDGGAFVAVLMPLSTCAISEYFAAQHITLEEGQQAEAGLEACDGSAKSRRLERGFALTIDDGHEAADLLIPTTWRAPCSLTPSIRPAKASMPRRASRT